MNCRSKIRAIALPLVLWCIAFLAGLVILTAGLVSGWIESESLAERKFVARQMALSGIALGLNPVVETGSPLLRHGNKNTEGYEVTLTNEAAKLNPNFWIQSGNRAVFNRLFASWGASLEGAEAAIDSLQDWIDTDDFVSLKGAERGDYERAGRSGYPANRPLKHIREMESVMNMAPLLATKQGWQDAFTIWYSGKISIQHAQEPLLKALAELTANQCQSLIQMRAGVTALTIQLMTKNLNPSRLWQIFLELEVTSAQPCWSFLMPPEICVVLRALVGAQVSLTRLSSSHRLGQLGRL